MDFFVSPSAESRLIFREAPKNPDPAPDAKEISLEGITDPLERVAKILAEGDEKLAREAITLNLHEVQDAHNNEMSRVWDIHFNIMDSVNRFGISMTELKNLAPKTAEGTMRFLDLVKKYLGIKVDESETTPVSAGAPEGSDEITGGEDTNALIDSVLSEGSENDAPEAPRPPNAPKAPPASNDQSEDGQDSFTGHASPDQMSNIDLLNRGESIIEAIKERDEFAEVRERLKKMKKEISAAILQRGATQVMIPPIHSDTLFLNFKGEGDEELGPLAFGQYKHHEFFQWSPYAHFNDRAPEDYRIGPYVDPEIMKEIRRKLGYDVDAIEEKKSPAQKQAEAARYWAAAQAIMRILDRIEGKKDRLPKNDTGSDIEDFLKDPSGVKRLLKQPYMLKVREKLGSLKGYKIEDIKLDLQALEINPQKIKGDIVVTLKDSDGKVVRLTGFIDHQDPTIEELEKRLGKPRSEFDVEPERNKILNQVIADKILELLNTLDPADDDSPEDKDSDPPENDLEIMSQEDLLKYVTPENIAKHIREGTVHELLLIIDASEHSDLIKNNYVEMIKRIETDIKELQNELDKAESLDSQQIRSALEQPPMADIFDQKKMPAFRIAGLSDEQLKTLHQCCILELHVRSKNIEYQSEEGDGGQFFSTLDPEGNGRTGDCNAVACYYASLVAATNSDRLKNCIKFLSVDGHAQVVFDLGGGKMISKNTSYVNMSAVDPNGENYHNFYDISEDQREYGFEKDGPNIMDMNTFLLGALTEVKIKIPDDEYQTAPEAHHLHNLRLYDHMLKHGYIGPSAIYSAFSHIQELHRRKSISKSEAQEWLGRYLDAYIAGSFGSALEIHNFKRTFGEDAARLFAQKYTERVLNNKKRFEDYILEPVNQGLHPSRADFNNRYRYIQAVFYFTENSEVKALSKKIFKKMKEYSNSKTA